MDGITKVKTRFRKEQWMHLIEERQNSGLTIKEWCSRNDISEHAYYYWLRRVRESACTEQLPVAQNESSDSIVFAPLKVNEKESMAKAPIIIHMPNADIEVRDGSSLKTLETVLSAIKSL